MSKPEPQLLPLELFEKPDVAERLADPLTLMMAALMAIESGPASTLALNRTRLAHEVAQKLVAERMKDAVEDHQGLFLHMAAYATLCGGLQEEDALEALEEESKQTRLGSVADPGVFLGKLQGWLPGEKTKSWIGVIEPDIVGEAFVLGQSSRVHLRDTEAAVLRAAAHRPASTVQAIVRMAQDFSFSETEERTEPLTWLATLVERGEDDNNFGLLFDLSEALPESSVVLRDIGLKISTILCDRLRAVHRFTETATSNETVPLLASALNTLAIRQSEAGQREAALKTAEEAAGNYRKLARRNRDAFLSDLAMSLNTLAIRQSEAGQREAALKTAEEAAGNYRKLAGRNRDAFLPDLAMSLNNLANTQSKAGRREAALSTAEEAADHYRELAGRNRDTFLPYLAASLNNLATMQSEAGQREAALRTAEEAAGHYRELAERNRDAFLPDLAMSLNNLANGQSEAGQREVALSTAEESVRLRRELAGRNRDAFLPDLAMSLNNLANRQSEAGQREAALRTAEEAVRLRRELVGRNRDAFLPNLAGSLNNLATMQREAGQREAGLRTAKEAAGHYRELAGRNRDAFLPYLAGSLNNLATMQSEAGQREAALKTAEEALRLRRELVGRNRDAFLPYLAGSLNNLAIRQSEAGQWEAALKTAEEAAGHYRELAERNRDAFIEGLAKACWTLGNILAALDRHAEAIKILREALHAALDGVRKYPAGYLGLCLSLLQGYLAICEEAKVQPDNDLMQEVVTVLEPYIKNKGE